MPTIWLPWQVIAFLALLTVMSAWFWVRLRSRAAIEANTADRARPTILAGLTRAAYVSMGG